MDQSKLCKPWEHQTSRRRFLGNAAGTAAGMGLGCTGGFLHPLLADELKKQEKHLIIVWLDGGISQLESWDPKPGTKFGGPFRAIPTSAPGVQFSELLPQTAKQAHLLAVLRSVHTKDNSHSAGVERILRGDPKNRGVDYPYLGSAVSNLLGPCPGGLPPYVHIKPGSGGFSTKDAGFLGAKFGALALGDAKPPENLLRNSSINDADDRARNELRTRINSRYGLHHRKPWLEANSYVYQVAQELMKRQDLFDEKKLVPRDVERYGTHELGRHLLQARRMIEAGVRCVMVTSYGWDSHGDNFNASRSLVSKFDKPFAALIEDLHERSMLDNTLVIACSEFGRTPRINAHVGRDHWPEAWSIAMAGSGIKRGTAVGKTNALGTYVDGQEYDIGYLFHTWFMALGLNAMIDEYDNHGQPLPIAKEDAHPIADLLA